MIRTLASILMIILAGSLHAEEKEGGIIGTGVIGQVTGLEKFEVSGMRFGFAPDIELKGIRSLADLRMGMTLVLSTGRDGAAWQVDTLQHMPPLTGPVTAPGEVMGVPVSGVLPTAGIVQVDGFWSEAGIVATRITAIPKLAAQVTGIYDGRGRIGLVPIQGADVSTMAAGQTVTVSGRFENGAIMVDTVIEGPFMGPSPDLLLLEGYFQSTSVHEALSLQGVAVSNAAAERNADPNPVRRCALRGRTDYVRSELTAEERDTVRSFCVSASN